jgi:hypothetical protein
MRLLFSIIGFLISLLFDILGYGMALVIVGFWWTEELAGVTPNTFNASLIRATLTLIWTLVGYYEFYFKVRRFHSPFRLYFFTIVSIAALVSYCYGVFFKWL